MSKEEKMEKRRRDNIVRGVGAMIISLIGYILIPYLIEWHVFPMVPDGFELSGFSELLDRWVLAGVPLMIVSLFVGHFGIGSRGWLASSIVQSLLGIFWVLYVLNFGDLTGIFSMEDDSQWMSVDIVIDGFMYLMIALKLLKLLIVYGDYRDNRSAYLEENDDSPGRKGKEQSGSDGIRVKGRFN